MDLYDVLDDEPGPEKQSPTSPTEGAQSDWIFDVTPPEVV
jgi:hypothetical protein